MNVDLMMIDYFSEVLIVALIANPIITGCWWLVDECVLEFSICLINLLDMI